MFSCDFMVDRKQVNFPKSRKRRIRAKWAKKQENYSDVPQEHVLIDHGSRAIIGHPVTIARLVEMVNART